MTLNGMNYLALTCSLGLSRDRFGSASAPPSPQTAPHESLVIATLTRLCVTPLYGTTCRHRPWTLLMSQVVHQWQCLVTGSA